MDDIHVCEDGPRQAPALLLIHGSAASTKWWYAMVPLLAATHRVIRVDLAGCGRSPEPSEDGYAIPAQARAVGAALDRLGVEHAVVVGHSSGGYAAVALAEERPDLVSALVLINTGPSPDAFIGPDTSGMDPSQWPPSDEQVRQIGGSAFSRLGYEPPWELLSEVADLRFEAFAATMRASGVYLARQAIPERLTVLGKALLVIFGEDDRRWRSSSAADYKAVPGAEVEMIPGIGHSPIVEDPERTAALLLAFAALHAPPSS